NTVAAYVKNENVANEGGEVILHKGLVDHKIVTFNGNGGKATIDGGEVETYTQKIVTNTNSKLIVNTFIYGGYHFDGWNTRPDGLGKDYTDEAVLNTSVDITLYAKWKAQ
ncbi:MAG: InlB B-repeat-containing protein, partial [Bacteroides sp.]|nr:InlB B-repeat-containing protein [Bacteroides sp.]